MTRCVRNKPGSKLDPNIGMCLAYQRADCEFCRELRASVDAKLAELAARRAVETHYEYLVRHRHRRPWRTFDDEALRIYEAAGCDVGAALARIADFDGGFWVTVRAAIRRMPERVWP